MHKVRVWEPSEAQLADEWRRRLVDSDAEVIAVLEPDQGELLPALLLQLGDAALICAYAPVSDALKVVVDGLVVGSIEREDVVELRAPFAFRVQSALGVLEGIDHDQPAYLLDALAAPLKPLAFRS